MLINIALFFILSLIAIAIIAYRDIDHWAIFSVLCHTATLLIIITCIVIMFFIDITIVVIVIMVMRRLPLAYSVALLQTLQPA